MRSVGVRTGPALLSARRYVYAQRTPREGYTHGANGVLQVQHGRRPWPPGSCLSPSWGRRDRLFQPLGLGGHRFPHTYPSRIHPISFAWLSSTCGVQGLCVHLQLNERQVDNCPPRMGRFWLRLQLLQQELQSPVPFRRLFTLSWRQISTISSHTRKPQAQYLDQGYAVVSVCIRSGSTRGNHRATRPRS